MKLKAILKSAKQAFQYFQLFSKFLNGDVPEVFEGVEPGGLRGQELEGVKEHGAPGEHKPVPASHQLIEK